MTLSAKDELRHTQNANPLWRESLYWNFNDPVQQIGAWIYLWVVPGNALPTGMIVSFYHGGWPDPRRKNHACYEEGRLHHQRGVNFGHSACRVGCRSPISVPRAIRRRTSAGSPVESRLENSTWWRSDARCLWIRSGRSKSSRVDSTNYCRSRKSRSRPCLSDSMLSRCISTWGGSR
jgi:hypothetical protein